MLPPILIGGIFATAAVALSGAQHILHDMDRHRSSVCAQVQMAKDKQRHRMLRCVKYEALAQRLCGAGSWRYIDIGVILCGTLPCPHR